jgi:hypothetical protein
MWTLYCTSMHPGRCMKCRQAAIRDNITLADYVLYAQRPRDELHNKVKARSELKACEVWNKECWSVRSTFAMRMPDFKSTNYVINMLSSSYSQCLNWEQICIANTVRGVVGHDYLKSTINRFCKIWSLEMTCDPAQTNNICWVDFIISLFLFGLF